MLRRPKPPVAEILPENLPRHVAIIMDGNGRWAKSRGLPRVAGHKKGADALREILSSCGALGLRYLTIYAFSAENWNRPQDEVNDLMELLGYYLHHELPTLQKNNIRLSFIGDRSRLSAELQKRLEEAEKITETGSAFTLIVALSYGARQEIVRAMRKLSEDVAAGKVKSDGITEEHFSRYLDTASLPDPDLIVRTGGEQRLSNFLLWQSAYSELYFTPVLWPDFTPEHLREALAEYARRERRYGTTS